ncbi:MAG: hypothetical protein U0L20_04080 [Ruminococcus sp.]|nr:hypothetical protein [Ruminococcus sp.]
MFKKIASIALAATMMFGAVATVSAAEESSSVAADSSSEVGASQVVNFDVKSAGWEAVAASGIFCHIYRVDGTGSYPGWQSKAEKCKYDASTGIATYDLSTGVKKGYTDLETIDSKKSWAIIFSAKSGNETYPALLSSECFGDTLYAPDKNKMLENNVDSEKKSVETKWKNAGFGAALSITSTAKIQGEALAEGETKETTLASYLVSYWDDADKLKLTQDLVNKLNVSPVEVMSSVKFKQAEAVKEGTTKQEDSDKIIKAIAKVLNDCKDPTNDGQKPQDVNKAPVKNPGADKNNNNSNNSNNSDKNTNANNSNASGNSGSVESGQETTIFFVFGGFMVAAAGVMFLARKKNA